ncbi:MAG TPA: GAF domain-containing protein [Anaeromyxobacteraceae bacterium]|nr:GAF domain-containing protein [Anaeromyxobacteraceae bacterium]
MATARVMSESEAPRRAGRAGRLLVGAHAAPASVRFGVALGLAAAAILASTFLPENMPAYRVLTYLGAVCLAALRGGAAPGLMALALCGTAYGVAQGGVRASFLEEPDPLHRLAFFCLFGGVGVWAASAIREGYRHTSARRRRAEARAHEQRIAAELGVRALAESDLAALVGETLGAVQRALACDSVTQLELLPAGDALRVRDVAGLGREFVGATLGPREAALAFRALEERRAFAVDDLADDPELAASQLRQSGVVSSLIAPIVAPGPRGRPFGTLGAHSRTRRRFTSDDVAFLQGAANVVGTAVVRLAAEEQTRQHLAFQRAIAASLAEGVYTIDREGRVTFANPAALRLLGWREEDLLGRVMHDEVHPRRPDGTVIPHEQCPIVEVLRSRRPASSQDDAFLRRDGTFLPVAWTAAPLATEAEVSGAVVAFQDFTEHVRTERTEKFLDEATRQLAQSIDWQETLQRVARLAVPFLGDWSLAVVVDDSGAPRSVAAAASDPSRGEVVRELLERYPIDRTAQHGVGRILRTGEPEVIPEASPSEFAREEGPSGELRRDILRRLGMRSYMGAPLLVGGRVLGAIAFGVAEGGRRFAPEDLAVAQALAQRCALALENARLYRAAQDASRVREEIMAVVSHDLKAPLGALLMGAQLVERLAPPGGEGDELRRASTTVRRTAERMRRLVHDLVDFAAVEAGRLSVKPAEHDAATIAREAAEAFAGVAEDRGLTLAVDAPESLDLACDRDRVLQVLANLLSNALHVTPPGGRVAIRVVREVEGILFAVTDTGPGIPDEELPRVFDRWYRGQRSHYPGSGLGLSIARAIVEAHGGRIAVESRPGQGSVFSFALPLGGLSPPRAGTQLPPAGGGGA